MRRELLLFVAVITIGFWIHTAQAGSLTFRSDTLSVSAPASGSDHTIKFTVFQEIPVSGKIVITPEDGDFTIPAGLDFTDIDLLDDSVQRTLAASPGSGAGSAVGVSVTSGTSGSITLTLNDTDTIAGSSVIEVRIGTNATSGTTGDQQITNPSSIGSYDIGIETQNAASVMLDSGGTVVAIVNRVGLSTEASPTPTPTPTPTPGGGGVTPPTPCSRIADVTFDCLVNLPDLSIMMYNWPVVRNRPETDLNTDGMVGIVDFSILLFWWTG
jgi:hypothetical protein